MDVAGGREESNRERAAESMRSLKTSRGICQCEIQWRLLCMVQLAMPVDASDTGNFGGVLSAFVLSQAH